MYHCQLFFYCVGPQTEAFEYLRQFPPLPHFTHTFTITREVQAAETAQADVIFADLRGTDGRAVVQALSAAKRRQAQLILLADKEQIPTLDLSQVRDVWITPISPHALAFRFSRWQQTCKTEQDLLHCAAAGPEPAGPAPEGDIPRTDDRMYLFDIFFNHLSASSNDLYIIIDRQGGKLQVEYITPNTQRVLGYSQTEVVRYLSAPRSEIGIIRQTMTQRESLEQMVPGTSLATTETEWVNPKTGVRKFFQIKSDCLQIHGRVKIIVSVSDRTREHEIQDALASALDIAQAANRAKSSFLSSVSHDIRTPLNAITGFLTLLREESGDPYAVREYTQRIDVASQQLLRLINDVLDMDKIESGSTTLNLAPLNLAQIVGELNSIIRPQANSKHQHFDILASPFTHERLLGDGLRINQVLINILSNAVKYTPEGGHITLRILELPQISKSHSHLRFIVSDTGQGMSPEYLEVIFTPFSREQQAVTKQIQGTGLGMAITKNLVDLMGGSIQVESTPNQGSTFTVDLSLRVQPDTTGSAEFWADRGIRRVLVASASEEFCAGVAYKLEQSGVRVCCAIGGQDLLRLLGSARDAGVSYELTILDWPTLGLRYGEIAGLLPQDNPPLLLTAYDWNDIEKEAAGLGADHFLTKPFFLTNLTAAVQRLADSRTGQGSARRNETLLKGKHILVVDDIDVNRLILVKILSTLGATCDTAENGQRAVERFAASRPGEYDIILMDVQMPVMGGYEATRAIRAGSHPGARTVPIIAMTANAFTEDVREALEAGMDAHIAKPIVLENMTETIQDVLTKKQNPQQPEGGDPYGGPELQTPIS